MSATGWLRTRLVRRRWSVFLPLVLVVALGGTGTLVAFEIAQRTTTAYPRYVERADVGDMIINPSLQTRQIDQVIRELPGVRQVTSAALLFADVEGDPTPGPYSQKRATMTDDDRFGAVLGSVDGRYTEMDRLAYREGRPPTGPAEAVVNTEMADVRGYQVGDIVPLTFWDTNDDIRAVSLGEDPLMTPVGVEQVTIVGIATLPGEVLPDALFPRTRMIVSPDITRRYDCLPSEPPADVDLESAIATLAPKGCSTGYRYWSVALDDGAADVDAATDAFLQASEERNASLPPALRELDVGYILIVTPTSTIAAEVDRAMQPTVAAFTVLGLSIAAVTVVVAALAMWRAYRRLDPDRQQWRELGLTNRGSAGVVIVPVLVALAVGVAVAFGAAWALSTLGPIGPVDQVEPSPAPGLGNEALWVMGAVTIALTAVALAFGWPSTARGRARRSSSRTTLGRALSRGFGVPSAVGVRAAIGASRDSILVVAGVAVATATVLAAVVFGASLSTLLATPAWHGWPWDAANLGGVGYGGVDRDAVSSALGARDDVDQWIGLGFWQSFTVNGVALPALITYEGETKLDLAMTEGRLPVRDDEVALGSRTADELDVGVGDEVALAGEGVVTESATVTGLVVLPAIGPLQSDRASPGRGLLLPEGALDPELASGLFTFVGIELTEGAEPAAVVQEMREDFVAFDTYAAPIAYSDPVVPTEVTNARDIRRVPSVVAGLMAVVAIAGLTAAIVASVGSRRREISVLRALGFTGRQLRRSVRVQSVVTVLAALVIGIPVGIAAGRFAWESFAGQLGVVPTPTVAVWLVVVTVVGALLAALIASVLPARLVTRGLLADDLRKE